MLVSLEVNFTLSTKLEEIHLAISLIETNLEGRREGWMGFQKLELYVCC